MRRTCASIFLLKILIERRSERVAVKKMVKVTRTTHPKLDYLSFYGIEGHLGAHVPTLLGPFFPFPTIWPCILELGVVGFAFLKSFHDGRLVHRHGVPIFCPSRNIFKCLYLYICCNYSNSRHSSMIRDLLSSPHESL
jgi:hypothetical protein